MKDVIKWTVIIGVILFVMGLFINVVWSDNNICERTCSDYKAIYVDSFFNPDGDLKCECDTVINPEHIIIDAR